MKFPHQVHMLSHNNNHLMLTPSNIVPKHLVIHAQHYTTCSWEVKQPIMEGIKQLNTSCTNLA